MSDPYDTTRPVPRHAEHRARHAAPAPAPAPAPTPAPAPDGAGRGIYREEALRHRAMSRITRMPLVISTPSFLALWLLVAALLVVVLLVTTVAVEAVA
ncbi:hypothetical protein [Nonomuraea sp. WAC 01424]|uniref:hypothetical protein n=1 Tax=Nonomuraea sp. WAC 01424 TaxID=2203200 RepID=UPI000F770897|nr:hypothetical protein [Nonomuraea sp. WAC 01424]